MNSGQKDFGEKERLIFLEWEEAFQKGGFGAMAHNEGRGSAEEIAGVAMLYSRMEIAQKHGMTGDKLDEIINYGTAHGWSSFGTVSGPQISNSSSQKLAPKVNRKKWWKLWR